MRICERITQHHVQGRELDETLDSNISDLKCILAIFGIPSAYTKLGRQLSHELISVKTR